MLTLRPIRAPCGWALRTAGRHTEGSQCRNPELLALGITRFSEAGAGGLWGRPQGRCHQGGQTLGEPVGSQYLGQPPGTEEMVVETERWRDGSGTGVPTHVSQVHVPGPQRPRVPVLRQHPRSQEQHEAPARSLRDLHPVRPLAALPVQSPLSCPYRLPSVPLGLPALQAPPVVGGWRPEAWPRASCASHTLVALGKAVPVHGHRLSHLQRCPLGNHSHVVCGVLGPR